MTPQSRGVETVLSERKIEIRRALSPQQQTTVGGILSRGSPTYVAPGRKSALTRHNYHSMTIVP